MGATLTVLGAGSILPRAGYGCSGYALRPAAGDAVTLLDCGPGSVRALGAAGIELTEVERVLVTHFHPDHCLDLLALAFARRNPALAAAPLLQVFGPRGLGRWWRAAAGALGRWVQDPNAALFECETDFALEEEVSAGPLRLRCAATGHTPEALAWRVDGRGASLTYSGDSGESPALARLARGTGLFVCECSFSEEEAVPNHLTPRGAARLASGADCSQLLLTHFYPSLDPVQAVETAQRTWSGSISAACDGSTHPVPPGSGPPAGPSAGPAAGPEVE